MAVTSKLIEELMVRFKVAMHPVFGNCIVIPNDMFEADWDDQLVNMNSEAHGQGDFVFVRIPEGVDVSQHALTRKSPEAKKTPEKLVESKRRGCGAKGPRWTEKEDKVLVSIANDTKIKRADVYKHYAMQKRKSWPTRSEVSILNRVSRLRKKGLVMKRLVTRVSGKAEKLLRADDELQSSDDITQFLMRDFDYSVIAFDGKNFLARIRSEDLLKWKEILFDQKKIGKEDGEKEG